MNQNVEILSAAADNYFILNNFQLRYPSDLWKKSVLTTAAPGTQINVF